MSEDLRRTLLFEGRQLPSRRWSAPQETRARASASKARTRLSSIPSGWHLDLSALSINELEKMKEELDSTMIKMRLKRMQKGIQSRAARAKQIAKIEKEKEMIRSSKHPFPKHKKMRQGLVPEGCPTGTFRYTKGQQEGLIWGPDRGGVVQIMSENVLKHPLRHSEALETEQARHLKKGKPRYSSVDKALRELAEDYLSTRAKAKTMKRELEACAGKFQSEEDKARFEQQQLLNKNVAENLANLLPGFYEMLLTKDCPQRYRDQLKRDYPFIIRYLEDVHGMRQPVEQVEESEEERAEQAVGDFEEKLPEKEVSEKVVRYRKVLDAAKKRDLKGKELNLRKLYKIYVALNKEMDAAKSQIYQMSYRYEIDQGRFKTEADKVQFEEQFALNVDEYKALDAVHKELYKLARKGCPAILRNQRVDGDEQEIQEVDALDARQIEKMFEEQQRKSEMKVWNRRLSKKPRSKQRLEELRRQEKNEREEEERKHERKGDRMRAKWARHLGEKRMEEAKAEARREKKKGRYDHYMAKFEDEILTKQDALGARRDRMSTSGDSTEIRLQKARKLVDHVFRKGSDVPDFTELSDDSDDQSWRLLAAAMYFYELYADHCGVNLNKYDWKTQPMPMPRRAVPAELVFERVVRHDENCCSVEYLKMLCLKRLCQDVTDQMFLVRQCKKQADVQERETKQDDSWTDIQWLIKLYEARREKSRLCEEEKNLEKQMKSLETEFLGLVRNSSYLGDESLSRHRPQ